MEDVLKTGLAISDMERRDILKVFAEKNEGRPGRWFKCRNGHYYIIGDCGGANQAALCFECKAPIGKIIRILASFVFLLNLSICFIF